MGWLRGGLGGAGDTWTSTKINLACYWAVRIPLAWLLAHTAGLGPRGVYPVVCGAKSLMAVVSIALFRRGHWKRGRL